MRVRRAPRSTLVASLIGELRAAARPVAVIAVDPSSPITGGALLGDRVRMQAYAEDPDVFIRSMAARGHAGGLASTSSAAAAVLDAVGFDVVLVETVGTLTQARSRSRRRPTQRSCSRRPRWATRSRHQGRAARSRRHRRRQQGRPARRPADGLQLRAMLVAAPSAGGRDHGPTATQAPEVLSTATTGEAQLLARWTRDDRPPTGTSPERPAG